MRKQSPSEGRIDKRMTALGVIGFLALAGSFFLLGFFPVGHLVRSYMQSRAQTPQTVYDPPTHRRAENKPAETQEQPQQPLDVQITEQGPTEPPTGDQTQSGDAQVNPEDNSLTITLEPQSQDSQAPAKPTETEKPRRPKPRQETVSIEKPRASTETTHSVTVSGKVYRVQAGTFASRANAETLMDDLKGRGYHPQIKAVQTEGSTLYRVQLGGFKTQAGAKDLAKDLSNDGYSPTLITEKAE